MNRAPRVSILMGVYNEERFIDRALQSIVSQSYQDWECVMIDDASTDETPARIASWTRRDPRFIVRRNEKNLRLCGSLNRGLGLCRGAYVARMDADDVMRPKRLEKQAAFLDANPEYALVSSSMRVFDDNGPWTTRASIEKPQKKDFLFGSRFAHPATMFRADVLREMNGYRELPMTRRTEDYDLFMRIYAAGYLGFNFQEPLLDYYESRESMKKRKYRYRIDEMRVRYDGYKRLGLLPRGLPYCVKPLIVGLMPDSFLIWMRRRSGKQDGKKETRLA